jgi:hypothetical protein
MFLDLLFLCNLVNYPRVNSWASCFNKRLIGETNELPSPQASIRAIPALHRKRMLSFRDVLVSLGQVSNNERRVSLNHVLSFSNEFVYRYKTSTKIHPDYFWNWFCMVANDLPKPYTNCRKSECRL